MAAMPWLYFRAPPHIEVWARAWQADIHRALAEVECVTLDPTCFIAPDCLVFAEPHRAVSVGARAAIAHGAVVHGPVTLADDVCINPYATLEGGAGGVTVGEGSRIATGARLIAFNHQISPSRPVHEQSVTSRGIRIGRDVWIGANVGVTDGVEIGDHAVVAMGAVVTTSVLPWQVVGGVPARVLGDRRTWVGDASRG